MLTPVCVLLTGVFFVVFAWSVYNLPILAAGFRNLRRSKGKVEANGVVAGRLPSFSIVVPVKNESKVLGRLFEALAKLNYPVDKYEVVVVEDGSSDGTLEICRKYAEEHPELRVKVFSNPVSRGKPSALNFGLRRASGELVGFFDADSVPDSDVLLNVAKYFQDMQVAGVQGRTALINSEENMLTKFASYEDAVWCEGYLRGKDVLGLFVHLRGSCQFVRRSVLVELGGFDESALSEDMELSARLADRGYGIRYAGDVKCWHESPSGLRGLFRQRTRWFRGTMEVAFRYGRLMAKPGWRSFDAEATLYGPFVLIFSLLSYFAGFSSVFNELGLGGLWVSLMRFTALTVTTVMFLLGLLLLFASRRKRLRDVLWVPFVYFYWSLQGFIAFYAVLLIVFRRPRKWVKTEKTGSVSAGFESK